MPLFTYFCWDLLYFSNDNNRPLRSDLDFVSGMWLQLHSPVTVIKVRRKKKFPDKSSRLPDVSLNSVNCDWHFKLSRKVLCIDETFDTRGLKSPLLRPITRFSFFCCLSISCYSDLGLQSVTRLEICGIFKIRHKPKPGPGQHSLRLPKKWFWPCLNPRVYFPCNKILMKIYNCENHHLMTELESEERSLVPGIKYLFEGCCKLFNRIAKLGKN